MVSLSGFKHSHVGYNHVIDAYHAVFQNLSMCACSKAAMALIREMFGLSVTLVPQGCMLPYEEDPVSPLLAHQRWRA